MQGEFPSYNPSLAWFGVDQCEPIGLERLWAPPRERVPAEIPPVLQQQPSLQPQQQPPQQRGSAFYQGSDSGSGGKTMLENKTITWITVIFLLLMVEYFIVRAA